MTSLQTIKFSQHIKVVSPKTKIQAKKFLDSGKYPIVSQEAGLINGYWDDSGDLMRFDKPVVVFGDHTRSIKYIDFDFVAGADGIKILLPPDDLNSRYFYYWLLANPVDSLGYARHFRILKEKEFVVPLLEEQRRVVSRLDAAFEKIDRAIELTEKNMAHAKGLYTSARNKAIQELAGDEYKFINDIGTNLDSKRIPITKNRRKSGPYPYYGASGIVDYVSEYIFDQESLLISEDGANILARSTPIAFVASGRYWVNNHAHIYAFPSSVTLKYIEYYLENTDLKPFVTGAAQPKLSQGNLNKIPIFIPFMVTQEKIVYVISQTKEASETLCVLYEDKLNHLKSLKQSMLTQSFSQGGVE